MPDEKGLSLQMRTLIEINRRQVRELAYFTSRNRNLLILILVINEMYDGSGMAVAGDDDHDIAITPSYKNNINPNPITAEAVQPISVQACDLPLDAPFVIDEYYQIVNAGSVERLMQTDEANLPDTTNWIIGSFFLKKGEVVTLENDGDSIIMKPIDTNKFLKAYHFLFDLFHPI